MRRLTIAIYLFALMVLTTSILLVPGKNCDTLTTSDSGYFFGIAREIDASDGMVEEYSLSHAPYGVRVGVSDIGQPLLLVMLYRGLHAVDPDVKLMDVCRYWSPLLFALTLIPIFLIGRELAGEVAGCAAAFSLAVMIDTIYWCKLGAFDREALQLLLTSWAVFLSIKMFRSGSARSIVGWGVLVGAVLGLFALSWSGWWYLVPVIVSLPLVGFGIGFLERLVRGTKVEEATLSSTREQLYPALGVVGMLVTSTLVLSMLGGVSPRFWQGVVQAVWGFIPGAGKAMLGTLLVLGGISFGFWCVKARAKVLGMGWFSLAAISALGVGWLSLLAGGGGGPSFSRYATEMQPLTSLRTIVYAFYSSGIWSKFVFILVGVGFARIVWSRKRWELLPLLWLLVLLALVWPWVGQARFVRLWWPFVAVMAGVGAGTIASFLLPRIPAWHGGVDRLQKPVALAVCGAIFTYPLISDAYTRAGGTVSPPDWSIRGLDRAFIETFNWIKANTPENAVIAIQWSYGHLLTGVSERSTVCDGAEVKAREGSWENDPSIIHPPDYIYVVEGNKNLIYGVDIPAERYRVNGRRIDVQRFPTMDAEELKWILHTYRENYGCEIDYLVIDAAQYQEAYTDYVYRRPLNILMSASRIRDSPRSVRAEDNSWVFDFGENRENVVVDSQNLGDVYLRTPSENLHLDGTGFLTVESSGRIRNVYFFPPTGEVEIPESLVIISYQTGNVNAWLVRGVSEAMREIEPPVGVLIFQGNLADVPYLHLVYTSSNGLVRVVRVDHERV